MSSSLIDHSPSSSESSISSLTLFVSNLHCPSCIQNIEGALSALDPRPNLVSHSIISHSVIVRHNSALPVAAIVEAFNFAGFEVHSTSVDSSDDIEAVDTEQPRHHDTEWEDSLEQAVRRWRDCWRGATTSQTDDMKKRQKHIEQCRLCRSSAGEKDDTRLLQDYSSLALSSVRCFASQEKLPEAVKTTIDSPPSSLMEDNFVVVDTASESSEYEADVSITGMTCAACVASITWALEQQPWVRSVNVSLLTHSATIVFSGKQHTQEVVDAIQEAGFDAALVQVKALDQSTSPLSATNRDVWRASYAIGGMTCSACSTAITEALKQHGWIESVGINLISHGGTIVFKGRHNLNTITNTIEDMGYEANLDTIINVGQGNEEKTDRSVAIRISGMYCEHCPERIMSSLKHLSEKGITVEKAPAIKDPILKLRYSPQPAILTIRHIIAAITATDPALEPSVHHPPTMEERARQMHTRERRRILLRLALSVVVAIPTFIIGIVWMDLVKPSNPIRHFMEQPLWISGITRSEWALFILSTPVYFFAADTFHRRALREMRALWRRGSPTPLAQRFYRFGSMNMLMSFGTSIAYFASITELAIAAAGNRHAMEGSYYFDSVVFLTMFLLIGRFLEAYSKAKTGDAVTSLGNLRPTEATLVAADGVDDQKISIDLLEIDDIVRVPNGSSPPFDGVVLSGESKFDESSLTGESRPVSKAPGDTVYSGTVNKGGPITIRIFSIFGTSMLDQIIKVVREGQTRRAPVERVADIITAHFVPFVVAVAMLTWVLWLSLGVSGALPEDYRDSMSGGWPLWSLRFAIAVFVIACPCGIGLAAPTALFVGGGLAARHGILVKGGGEAFQEASSLDCVVFDKTGTLTQGGDPAVTDFKVVDAAAEYDVLGLAKKLEENSGHPIAKGIVAFCTSHEVAEAETTNIEELPGKGMKGTFKVYSSSSSSVDVIVGNEALMADYDVHISEACAEYLHTWKTQGKSVVLLAFGISADLAPESSPRFKLAFIFAIADPLRPEAASTVSALHRRGINVWILSGDNELTARAVGAQVGIPSTNIIAGVLPDQKAEKIKYLQRSLTKPQRRSLFGLRRRVPKRATIAMVGDGINDSPALTAADVGIAIGSGSDIAISSASFVLVNSNLISLLTLIDLSRTVFRRVWFNFGWALVYNVIAMPVAAGVLYPLRTGSGGHIRLDPVWASLAMALSSVSVVCSSLALRSSIPGLGFRAPKGQE
ncbi:hypothetical protein W97_03420 [Coniosporium apollinis CBS 100218]|uniref:HMA domain-containing protein n=1 Tax=Coniosporium apollinis (strain CBS 100218) TaxID=1168221 RepID=R7YQJ4_CONA1|nr:uncharacterized protein W97_03420 [Coniosporium apollinis CBS 100218]EON64190.1 hypothetical protein W97_03420 [Coniosporium apollinis CBS 100218]